MYPIKIRKAALPVKVIYLAMPDPRVVVVGVMPEAEFIKAVANQGKPSVLSAELLTRARQLEKNEVWALLTNRGLSKRNWMQSIPHRCRPCWQRPSLHSSAARPQVWSIRR